MRNHIRTNAPTHQRTSVSRLTITLSDERYRALKEASAQRGKTIGQLIDESLEFYGIKSHDDARDWSGVRAVARHLRRKKHSRSLLKRYAGRVANDRAGVGRRRIGVAGPPDFQS